MNVFEFDIGVSTHDLLREGMVVRHYTRVTVAAATFEEARLIACEMACIDGWMATEALVRI